MAGTKEFDKMRLGLAMVDSLKEFESRMRSSSCLFHVNSYGPCGDANRGNSTRQWVCARIQLPKIETYFCEGQNAIPDSISNENWAV